MAQSHGLQRALTPSILAGGNAGALVRFLEPWNDAGRFRSMTSGGLVVVWEDAVKRVLSRRKLYGNQIYEMFRASGSAERVTSLSHRSHQIGTFGGFSWRMRRFVSFRIVALAFIAAFVTQVTCAYASVSFSGSLPATQQLMT